jgi:hypothetical protein
MLALSGAVFAPAGAGPELLLPRVPAGRPTAIVVQDELMQTFGVPELLMLPRLMTSSKFSERTTAASAVLGAASTNTAVTTAVEIRMRRSLEVRVGTITTG